MTAGAPVRVRVERLAAEYLVPEGHPDPGGLRARLDAAAARPLADALRAALAGPFRASGDEVWLIRRLRVELDVDAGWDRRRVARAWATAIGRGLTGMLEEARTGGGDQVVRFDDRIAHLSCFLDDLARGEAWGRWYHRPFHGLKPLPVSAAIRTAVAERPATGWEALERLPDSARRGVVGALSAADADRVLGLLERLEGPPDPDSAAVRAALAAAWAGERAAVGSRREEARAALAVAVTACCERPAVRGAVLARSARALARLVRRLDEAGPPGRSRLLRALAHYEPAALHRVAGPGDAAALAPLAGAPLHWLRSVTGAGQGTAGGAATAPGPGDPPGRRQAAAGAEGERRATPFGGLFLLLPRLAELPLTQVAGEWPPAGPAGPGPALRLLIVARCLGGARAGRVFRDPVVRDLLGVPPAFSPVHGHRWQATRRRELLDELLAALAAAPPDAAAGAGVWALRSVRLPYAPAAVLLDARTGVWLWASGHAPGRLEPLFRRMEDWLDRVHDRPGLLLADPPLVGPLRSRWPDVPIEPIGGPAASERAEADPRIAAVLPRLPHLSRDLRHLTVARGLRAGRAADLALSVVAQNALRRLAARLPGFHASGLPYLWANFLDFRATVESDPERLVVRLAHPPLHLVLGLSGLAREHYRLPWLPDRPVALFPEGVT